MAAHLHAAVERHRRWCRDNGITVPSSLLTLVDIVTIGQEPSECPSELNLGDDGGVALAVDYQEAGRLLGGSSVSTVYRLVKSGRLRAVTVGTAKRVPRSELERFIRDQLDGKVS